MTGSLQVPKDHSLQQGTHVERMGRGVEPEAGADGLVFERGVAEERIEFGEVGALKEYASIAHLLEEG